MKVYTDGASRGNPGNAGIGIYCPDLNLKLHEYLGVKTNNEAEYLAVKKALEEIKEDNLEFQLDSELVVKQLNGEYKVKKPELQQINLQIRKLIGNRNITFAWIPRNQNSVADSLANIAIDETVLK